MVVHALAGAYTSLTCGVVRACVEAAVSELVGSNWGDALFEFSRTRELPLLLYIWCTPSPARQQLQYILPQATIMVYYSWVMRIVVQYYLDNRLPSSPFSNPKYLNCPKSFAIYNFSNFLWRLLLAPRLRTNN